MGKKSRRKGGDGAAKATRKERLRGRREQILEDIDERPRISSGYDRPFFVGDRVWILDKIGDRAWTWTSDGAGGETELAIRSSWRDESNPNNHRGIVKNVHEHSLDITPLQLKIDGNEDYYVRANFSQVFPDFCDLTLRFDVGDKVLCLEKGGWEARTVQYLWPIRTLETHGDATPSGPEDMVPRYDCGDRTGDDGYSTAPCDDDTCIRRRNSTFRLRVGDNVTFNLARARLLSSVSKQMQHSWVQGAITSVDIRKMKYYASYKCEFQANGKRHFCHIVEDDDETIARSDADPRSRLLESIEQGCSREHLIHLSKEFKIDVTTFRDLIIAKAVEHASYPALSWLQYDCDIDVVHIKDDLGNNLLHKIAFSQKAVNFIKEAAKVSTMSHIPKWKLNMMGTNNKLTRLKNNEGQIWLDILVIRGDTRAFDAALSPHVGLAWELSYHSNFETGDLIRLSQRIRDLGNTIMNAILESFVAFRTSLQQCRCIEYCGNSEKDFASKGSMQVFQSKDSAVHARRLARFYLDWRKYMSQFSILPMNLFGDIVTKGFSDFFELMYNANEGIFTNEKYKVWSRNDRREYTQPELVTISTDDNLLEGDIFFACAIGDSVCNRERVDHKEVLDYLEEVHRYAIKCDKTECQTWLYYLKKRQSLFSRIGGLQKRKRFWERKINILEDDESLVGRVKILEFLLQRNSNPKSLNPLELIQNRQSGMLKFMVERGMLRLQEKASLNLRLKNHVSTLQFLAKGHIPREMSTNTFLCFATVQYDDLASLEYLCQLSRVPVELCDGLNLLHFCSLLGRAEIVAYLSRQPVWNALIAEPCCRAPYQNAYVVHIAASTGHIMLADMLLALNVPKEDKRGKLPEHYAKKSAHQFVREWASKRELPAILERRVKKLLELISLKELSVNKLKSFIITSKCLDPEVWAKCGFHCFDTEGPLGRSFGDLLLEFCINFSDKDFVICFCTSLYFESIRTCFYQETFWKERDLAERKILTSADLLEFAVSNEHDDLAKSLDRRWCKDVSCCDPLTQNSLLQGALSGTQLLQDVRSKILRIIVLEQIVDNSDSAAKALCTRGGSVDELAELLRENCKAKTSLVEEGRDDSSLYGSKSSWIFEPLDMTNFYTDAEYGDNHPLRKSMLFEERSVFDMSLAHIVLATESRYELLEHCLKHVPGWSRDMELDVCHIASLSGHADFLSVVLNQDDVSMVSSQSDRVKAAMLGTVESCRCRELSHLVDRFGPPFNPIKDQDPTKHEGLLEEVKNERWDELKKQYDNLVRQSLIFFALNGYTSQMLDPNTDDRRQLKTLHYLVDHLGYTHEVILGALICLWKLRWNYEQYLVIINLLQDIIHGLHLKPIMHGEQMRDICKIIVHTSYDSISGKPKADLKRDILEWLEQMANLGVDIQHLFSGYSSFYCYADFMDKYHELEQRQLHTWEKFDIIKSGGSLEGIQQMIHQDVLKVDSRDRGGLKLTHLSAAYDRADLLKWLVTAQGMLIDETDGHGRTVLDIARASKAPLTTKWIVEWVAKRKIASFVWQKYHRMVANRRRQRLFYASTTIQASFRGHMARKIYCGVIMYRLEESQRFHAIWGQLIKCISDENQAAFSSWASIRENVSDMNHAESMFEEDSYFDETNDQLSKALEDALQAETDDMKQCSVLKDELDGTSQEMKVKDKSIETKPSWLSFQMTSHVVKFLKKGDLKYKKFFVRRMIQLANGDQSRILQKRLKGSQSTIYESYLEQKSGFRILWTEEGNDIIVWFVAKHKDVSRLAKLIDDSKSRSARQHCPEHLLSQLRSEHLIPNATPRKEIILDVFSNAPMKLYDVSVHSIGELTLKDWSPKLHLTEEERDVVEAEGTTLVLGRSGTGKTVCICNRMEYDRQKYGQDLTFGQMFISRSARLCRYVAATVGKCDQNTFCTFDLLIYDIEAALPKGGGKDNAFLPSQHVNYQRFRKDFFDNRLSKDHNIGQLIVWTVIRTFLKGSIEAFKSPEGILPRDDFVVVSKLGKNRCRVPGNLREYIYDFYLKYEAHKSQLELWDDCDRIRHLLLRLDDLKRIDAAAFEKIRMSRIYVDEVQDYNQIELLLFFILGGPGGLFLAGDPAQSVVEGTSFRFDEVRSVGHFVAGNNKSRDLIPQKPKIVNVNYRSHSGILNAAGAVLDLLYSNFPSSLKQLQKDHGVFQGSRPSLLYRASVPQLAALLSGKLKGTVVLCHDDSTTYWRRTLGEYKLVYGIREAKGLEFKSVIILNFFNELPALLQKPWRNMLLNRKGLDFEANYPIVEAQLKLLYTGITRSIERLFFVETSPSISFDAAVRWLTTPLVKRDRPATSKHGGALATRNNITDIEAMEMTSDEFLSEGFNNAEMAESPDVDLEMAQNFLDKSIWCFDQAGNSDLARKTRAHRLSILFRMEVIDEDSRENDNDSAMVVEIKGAQMMESLTREGLMFEVLNIFNTISPSLTASTKEAVKGVLST